MHSETISRLIVKGKIKVLELPSKIEESRRNQILLLKDDLDNVQILLEKEKFRGAFIHAFNAYERAIDIFLISKGYKVSDRYPRKVLIGELLGKELLGEYEELFEFRKTRMYDRFGIITEPEIKRLTEELVPKILGKSGERI